MEKLDKTEFVSRVHKKIKEARSEFERISILPDKDSDAVFYVENAMTYGHDFMANYRCLMLGVPTNELLTTYYETDEHTLGFCPNEMYEMLKVTEFDVEQDDKDGYV